MRLAMTWRDAPRRLSLRLAPGSRMLPPAPRRFEARVAGSAARTRLAFAGRTVEVRL
jgi:hypothetical protein